MNPELTDEELEEIGIKSVFEQVDRRKAEDRAYIGELQQQIKSLCQQVEAAEQRVAELEAERDRLKEESDTFCRALVKLRGERDELRRRLSGFEDTYLTIKKSLRQWAEQDKAKSEGSR